MPRKNRIIRDIARDLKFILSLRRYSNIRDGMTANKIINTIYSYIDYENQNMFNKIFDCSYLIIYKQVKFSLD